MVGEKVNNKLRREERERLKRKSLKIVMRRKKYKGVLCGVTVIVFLWGGGTIM